jgi:exopolysaccharide production protein ExoQ
MSKASRHPPELGQPRSSAPMLDKYAMVPISACVYALIVSPLLAHYLYLHLPPGAMLEPDLGARIFWPALAMISAIFVIRDSSRLRRLSWPPHILWLFACLALAGASVLWAFKPESSFVRFAQQVMIVTSIVLPALLADRRADMMRALFLCFAFASVLNVFFVLGGDPIVVQNGPKSENIGYPGYFLGKNYLGECATLAMLLSVHEMLYPGLRRALGIIVVAVALFLVIAADSKTALGLAIVTPCLAGLTLIAAKKMRLSPAIILLSIPLCYALLSSVSNFNINRLSYMIYGDSTLTGRTLIWDFATSEIARRPLFGWGYQSFWLVGSDAPSIVDAPGWIKMMPNAHNGYYDTTLERGYVGYYLLVIFILATLHAIGRVAYRDAARAWLLLSLALYIICFNYLESLWMRGFEFLWVVFLIVAAEIGRYWQPLPQKAKPTDTGFAVPRGLGRYKTRGGTQETLSLVVRTHGLKSGFSKFGPF